LHGRCGRRGYVFKDECWVAKHIWKSPACRQKFGPEFWLPDWFPRERYAVCDYCRDVYSLQSAQQHSEACEEKANERNTNGPWMKECNLTMKLARAHGLLCTQCYEVHAPGALVCQWVKRKSMWEFAQQRRALMNLISAQRQRQLQLGRYLLLSGCCGLRNAHRLVHMWCNLSICGGNLISIQSAIGSHVPQHQICCYRSCDRAVCPRVRATIALTISGYRTCTAVKQHGHLDTCTAVKQYGHIYTCTAVKQSGHVDTCTAIG